MIKKSTLALPKKWVVTGQEQQFALSTLALYLASSFCYFLPFQSASAQSAHPTAEVGVTLLAALDSPGSLSLNDTLDAKPIVASAARYVLGNRSAQSLAFTPEPVAHSPAADTSMGFNLAFLQGNQSSSGNLDVRSLLGTSGAVEGLQRVDVIVGRAPLGRRDIVFKYNKASNDIEPCFSLSQLELLGVDMEKVAHSFAPSETCIRLPELIPDAKVHYDANSLALSLEIPQYYLTQGARGYIDEAAWDDGVKALWINYNLNARHDAKSQYSVGRKQTQYNGYFDAGLNIGPWRLRNNSSYSENENGKKTLSSQNTYLQRSINSWKSHITLGETYTASPLFEGVRILGGVLRSDEEMLPDSEMGYAPVIRGVANSNATIEVRQNGYLVYTRNVSAGPFEISNLLPAGSGGNLLVTIIESDGSRREFVQAYSRPVLMVREGRFRYDVSAGQVRLHDAAPRRPHYGGVTGVYGLTSNLTLASGLQYTDNDFQAYGLGVGLSTQLGAFSLQGTHSRSKTNGQSLRGSRWSLNYQNIILSSGSGINASYERSLQQGYRSLAEHAASRENVLPGDFAQEILRSGSKEKYTLHLSQRLPNNDSMYASISSLKSWSGQSMRTMSLSYGGVVARKYSYNLSLTRSYDVSGRGESGYRNALMLSFSIPLGSDVYSPNMYGNVAREAGRTSYGVGVNGQAPIGQEALNYSLNTSKDSAGGSTNAAFVGYSSSYVDLNAGVSHSKSRGFSSSMNVAGSVVAHEGGLNMGRRVSEGFGLAKVEPPMAGLEVSTVRKSYTRGNGYAIVNSMTPYRTNWVGLTPVKGVADIELNTTMQEVVPTRGAVALSVFNADRGQRAQFTLLLSDGSRVPFGAAVTNDKGELIGMTDPFGRVLLLLSEQYLSGKLFVNYGDEQRCEAGYAIQAKESGQNYVRTTLECVPLLPAPSSQDADVIVQAVRE